MPFGIMSDSLKTVSSYDKKIRELFGNLKQTFEEFDQDGTGLISWKEFRSKTHTPTHPHDELTYMDRTEGPYVQVHQIHQYLWV